MKKFFILIILLIILGVGAFVGIYFYNNKNDKNPNSVLKQYYSYISKEDYSDMYSLLNDSSKEKISEEDFIKRNKNIYQGISLTDIKIKINDTQKESNNANISYNVNMDTTYGEKEFSNSTKLVLDSEGIYKIEWNSNMIFPELNDDYKVRVNKNNSIRGSILDRNGIALATQGEVSSVGIVPGKLGENKEENIAKISEILGTSTQSINKTLSSSWVKDDSFVPIKNVALNDTEIKDKLLQIPGVKISSKIARVYPYGEITAHITGYVQNITAEELEKNKDKGYNSNSVIGKKGLEKQYEDRLRGIDGVEIYIVDSNNNKVSTILETDVKHGEDINITIDLDIQKKLYDQLKDDKGLFVVMHPKTGELLALVSTPSYDANKFVLGMSNDEWKALSENEAKPMYTRYLQTWCPGSTFKSVTGAIGLSSGKLSENDEFTYNGLAWQKDKSWGSYEITTLTAYNSAKNLRNGLIHSDNIYFAQASLKIGADTFMNYLDKIKFNENIDVLNASKSKYSNSGKITKETLLADSGYGQGEILVNPVHMASIYSAFVNNGNMVKPYIEYKEQIDVEYLVEGAFTPEASNIIKEDLIQVIENNEGTAHDMKINGVPLAGKTGTAELKKAKGEEGEILSWFDCFVTDENYQNQLLVISMVENARDNGGSHYLIKKIRTLFE